MEQASVTVNGDRMEFGAVEGACAFYRALLEFKPPSKMQWIKSSRIVLECNGQRIEAIRA
jgi:hypothetical protein